MLEKNAATCLFLCLSFVSASAAAQVARYDCAIEERSTAQLRNAGITGAAKDEVKQLTRTLVIDEDAGTASFEGSPQNQKNNPIENGIYSLKNENGLYKFCSYTHRPCGFSNEIISGGSSGNSSLTQMNYEWAFHKDGKLIVGGRNYYADWWNHPHNDSFSHSIRYIGVCEKK